MEAFVVVPPASRHVRRNAAASRCAAGRRGSAAEPAPSSSERSALASLLSLLEAMPSGGIRGVDDEDVPLNELRREALTLENARSLKTPARSSKLYGRWRLRFTDDEKIFRNKGVTGLGRLLPLSRLAGLWQSFHADGSTQTTEQLRLLGVMPMRNELQGKFRAVSATGVEQFFERARLGLFPFSFKSSFTMDTVALHDALRVVRSSRGSLFIFTRDDTEAKIAKR